MRRGFPTLVVGLIGKVVLQNKWPRSPVQREKPVVSTPLLDICFAPFRKLHDRFNLSFHLKYGAKTHHNSIVKTPVNSKGPLWPPIITGKKQLFSL